MSQSLPATSLQPDYRGYLSEQDKQKFTITAGILGALCFFGQFIIPFIAMVALMPAIIPLQNGTMWTLAPNRSAYWQGRIWFLEQQSGPRGDSSRVAVLKYVLPEEDQKPVRVADFPDDLPWLLPSADRLWVISSSKVGHAEVNGVQYEEGTSKLGDISRPFLYLGQPATIARVPEGLALAVFDHGDWSFRWVQPVKEDTQELVTDNLQVVTDGERAFVFRRIGSTLYGFETTSLGDPSTTQQNRVIGSAGSFWQAFWVGDSPAVMRRLSGGGTGSDLQVLQPQQDNWEVSANCAVPGGKLAGVSLGPSGELIVLSQFLPGSFRVTEIQNGTQVRSFRLGRMSPFSKAMITMMTVPYLAMILLPFALALALTALMEKHRVCHFEAGSTAVPFAPLSRRAVAQLLDSLVLGAPFILGSVTMGGAILDPEAILDSQTGLLLTVTGLLLFLVGIVWTLIGLVAYAWLEGRYGVTPGKWIAGIRVLGPDLLPCGFGRAIVRNLLKFVDGFFSFVVGVMIAALSENWQRLGDMAARTIVVRRTELSVRSQEATKELAEI